MKKVIPFTLVGYEIDNSQFTTSPPTRTHEKMSNRQKEHVDWLLSELTLN